jgi:Flp pilus assembly protein TadG
MAMIRRPSWNFRFFRRFRKDQSGTTAIEFGFVAMPFFALMFAIIETSLSFFTSQVLETAVDDASRAVMTGQIQDPSKTLAQQKTNFMNKICAELPGFFDCQNNVQIDVQTYAAYAGSNASKPLVNGTVDWTPQFNPGTTGSIVVVRAIYPMTTYTNFYGLGLANTKDGKLLLMATSAFKNEPFPTASPTNP